MYSRATVAAVDRFFFPLFSAPALQKAALNQRKHGMNLQQPVFFIFFLRAL